MIDAATGAEIPSIGRAREIWVAPGGTGDGRTSAAPTDLATALQRACQLQDKGRTARVIFRSGVYKSCSVMPTGRPTGAYIFLEAEHAREAIISGSDIWSDWVEEAGLWHHSWPFNWELGRAPKDYGNSNLKTPDLMRRREMLFVEGRRLRQVLECDELEPGAFFVDTARRSIFIRPPAGLGAQGPRVEVAIRSSLMRIYGRSNIVIGGLKFQHDGSHFFTPQRAALQVTNCRNVLIEDCLFNGNNNKGLQLDGPESSDVTVRRVVSNDNGCLGILCSRPRNLLMEDCETSANNWRGAWAGFYRGSPAGMKIMRGDRVTLRRHRSIRNLATGVWFDVENGEVRLEDCTLYGNYRGLHLEAGRGPAVIERCHIIANRQEPLPGAFRWAFGSGLVLTHFPDALVRNCFLADNDIAQLGVRDDREKRVLIDNATGERSEWHTERLAFLNNTVVTSGLSAAHLRIPHEGFDDGRFQKTFRSDRNSYITSRSGGGFLIGASTPGSSAQSSALRSEKLDVQQWRSRTGQDENSRYDGQYKAES